GFGSSFQLVIQVWSEATRSRTERWALRLIHFVVSSANQRSTRLSQELWVGVKWSVKRGWRRSQRWIDGVLWVEELSSTTCTSRCAGTEASSRFKKRRNSSARCRGVISAITCPEATSSAANRLVVPLRT